MTKEQLHKEENQVLIKEYKDLCIKAHKEDGDYDKYMKTYSDKIVTIADEETFRKRLSEEIVEMGKLINCQNYK